MGIILTDPDLDPYPYQRNVKLNYTFFPENFNIPIHQSKPINLRLDPVEIPKLKSPIDLTIDDVTSPEAESKEKHGVW
jgi:hypothetical protein